MILPYPLRLLSLCLATFFLVHLILGLAALLLTPAAIRLAGRIRPCRAARLLLGWRLFPLGGSVFLVAGLCVPSFLWLEPKSAAEEVGPACLAAGMLAVALWGISVARGLGAIARSSRYVDRCLRSGHRTYLAGEVSPVWVIEDPAGCLVLAGIVHPRVILSRSVVNTLSAGQLSAALLHERAHQRSRDNLKRLLLLLAPDVLPFWRCFGALERGWTKFAEWAADDGAVGGDSGRSLSLAAALVRVARLGPARQASPLVTCLVDDRADLSARVDRLLHVAPPGEAGRAVALLMAGACMAAISSGVAVMLQPGTLHFAHRFLERLIH
jgi:Zn-dependent protease with chaperone function